MTSVVVNITTIPPRFQYLQALVDNLKTHSIVNHIVVHVPRVYNVETFTYDNLPVIEGAEINLVDVDYGPVSRYIYAKGNDVIIILDDDTWYDPDCSKYLVNKHRNTGHVWGGSGFNFKKYFLGDFSKTQDEQVQIIEGYGMIVLNRKIIDTITPDLIKYSMDFKTSDDILVNAILEKYNVQRFFHCDTHWYKQLGYGFNDDALHMRNNGSHIGAYKKSMKKLRELEIMHFRPIVSYGITVCTEARELEILLEVLVDNMIHSDEIVILVDAKKVTDQVKTVINKFTKYVTNVTYISFNGNFAQHKNNLNDMSRGEFVFQLDADEVPTGMLLEKLYYLTNADLVFIPRVNIMLGWNEEAIKMHKFNLNQNGYINWPDMQGRFYRRNLMWEGKLHEKIVGAQRVGSVPQESALALWHIKTTRKSAQQNDFYSTLN